MVFNATLNNIEAVSFIGRGNRSSRRKPKPPICPKSDYKLLSHNAVLSTPRHGWKQSFIKYTCCFKSDCVEKKNR